MILVEGPDGAGKTTLVNQLALSYGLPIGARGTSNRDLLWTVTVPDTFRALKECVGGKGAPVIWDRLYYSDFVYAPLWATPRDVAFNASQQSFIDRIIEAARFPIIVCLPRRQTVLQNIRGERHQMPGVVERAEAIYDEYRNMYKGEGLKPFPDHRIRYDYDTEEDSDYGLDHVKKEIKDYLEEREERQP